MLIIPAINLLGDKVLWLSQGDPTRSTVYSDDPVAVARQFVELGARRLYVHDLDSRAGGDLPRLDAATRIAIETGLEVQFASALADDAVLQDALARPFTQIVLRADCAVGTPFLGDALGGSGAARLVVRLDVRDGNVTIETPGRAGVVDPVVLARELVDAGAPRLIYSDLNRDGMLGGPNYAGLRALLRMVDAPVMVSGGIAHADHIRTLDRLGVEAAIVGKALYTGDLSLRGHLDDHGHWR